MTGTRDVRRRLLDSTVELLSEAGVRGTTPAAVAERAGASKMSLYRHFEGIDDLMASALGEYDEPHRARLLAPGPGSAADRLLAMFDRAAARADDPSFRGCVYVSTVLAMEDLEHPAFRAASAHKHAIIGQIRDLLAEGGDATPGETATVIQMLMDGALIHASLRGSGEPIRAARRALPLLSVAVFGPAG